jgi:hypothetical protein
MAFFIFIETSRVNEDTFFGFIIQQVGVFLEGVKNKFFNVDHNIDVRIDMCDKNRIKHINFTIL